MNPVSDSTCKETLTHCDISPLNASIESTIVAETFGLDDAIQSAVKLHSHQQLLKPFDRKRVEEERRAHFERHQDFWSKHLAAIRTGAVTLVPASNRDHIDYQQLWKEQIHAIKTKSYTLNHVSPSDIKNETYRAEMLAMESKSGYCQIL